MGLLSKIKITFEHKLNKYIKTIFLSRYVIFVSYASFPPKATPPKHKSRLEVYLFGLDSSPSPTSYLNMPVFASACQNQIF